MNMKVLASILLAAVLAHGVPARAGSPGKSPLVGTWAVDTSRLPMAADARPRSATITFENAGDGRWTTMVEVVDAAGGKRYARGTSDLDGTPAPVESNFEADVAATTMPQPNVLVMQLAQDGAPASTRIYAVAADGASMTETAAYFGTDGQPIMRTNHFMRVR